MTTKPVTAPEGLSDEQSQLWIALVTDWQHDYSTRTQPGRIQMISLRRVVDVAGRLAKVRDQIDADGVMVDGSMGQKRAHPLLAFEANLRRELADAVHGWHLN